MSASWRISRMKFYEIEEKSLPKMWAWHHCWRLSSLILFRWTKKFSFSLTLTRSRKNQDRTFLRDSRHNTSCPARIGFGHSRKVFDRARITFDRLSLLRFFFGRSRPIDTRINYNPNLWAKKHRQARNLPRRIDQQQPKLFERMKIPQRHTEGAKAR